MKNILTLIVLVLMVQLSFAQEEVVEEKDQIKTVFSKDNLKFTGGYLAPELKASNVHEDISLIIGGKVGFTFNDKFSIGLAGHGLTSHSNFDIPSLDPLSSAMTPVRIGMGYGGLSLEYTVFSDKVIHFTIPVVTGVAGVFLYEDKDEYFYDNFNEIENTAAFVFEPGVNVEINLFKFFRMDLGVSYRLIKGTDLKYLSDEDLSDLSFNVAFKFGFF